MADVTAFNITQAVTTIQLVNDVYEITTELGEVDILTIGVQGPPGTSVIETFIHNQTVASTLWTINHGLNRWPSVMVVDSTKREVIVGVRYIDANTIQIYSDYAFAGQAFLN